MDLNVDPRPPVKGPVGTLEPSDRRAVDMGGAVGGSRVEPGRRQDSYWAECECPADCPRDHENE